MSQLFTTRSLSTTWWSNYNLCCLCCLIVLALNTCQSAYSANNTSISVCRCNSTTGPSGTGLNATKNTCNCTQDKFHCGSGFQLLNSTCVACSCNATTNCNCSTSRKRQHIPTCLPGQFLVNSSRGQKCKSCNCSAYSSLNNICNNRTGQCPCKEHVTGKNCTICATNYTGNFSSSGELLNCFELCPKGFLERGNECIKVTATSLSLSTKGSSLMSSINGAPVSTDRMVPTTVLSATVLASLSTGIPFSSLPPRQKIPSSTYLVPSPSITILQSTRKSPSIQIESPTVKSLFLTPSQTVKSSTTTIIIISPTVMSPSSTVRLPTLTVKSQSLTIKSPSPAVKSPSPAVKSPSPAVKLPSTTMITLPSSKVLSPPHTISPSTTKSPSPSRKVPLPTGQPTSTNTPTSVSTPDHVPTARKPSTAKPGTETDKPSSEKPTTEVHHSSEKMTSKDRESDVLVIVLVCLGVVIILGIAIAVGCWCLRLKRKPSTPFWSVELSSTRNEDFALLDPVTDEPHRKANDTSELDASITEHSRYYAYI